jgi:hypothetical protein
MWGRALHSGLLNGVHKEVRRRGCTDTWLRFAINLYGGISTVDGVKKTTAS